MRKLFALLLVLYPLSAAAWTSTSDERIALKAAQLAPGDLKLLIDTFEADYKLGLSRAQMDEGDSHRYLVLSRKGRLRQKIESETAGAIAAIRTGKPMSDVVQRLGMLAHYVADANNPFHLSNDSPKLELSRNDYEQYFERRLAKFPTVFYGLEPDFKLGSYLDRTFARTAAFYPLLDEEYFRDGTQRSSAEFDDRSTAFGVASICYSRAVTDLVNLYFHIWRQAGGDVRAAPILRGGNLFLNAN
ncbi:MAG: hypothetical protein JJE51_12970 [Thermoanaerobaculia bacterium]|nr:hypothetical protein [Thermoanaerobaculia bacterium]